MNKNLKILLLAYGAIYLLLFLIIAAIRGIIFLINSYKEKKLKKTEQEAKEKWKDMTSEENLNELCKIKFFIRKKDESITNEKMDFCIHIAHYDDFKEENLFWSDITNERSDTWENRNYQKFQNLSTILLKTIDKFTNYSLGEIKLNLPKTSDSQELSEALIKMTLKINEKLNDQNDKNEYIDITDEVLEVLNILKENKNLNQNIDNDEEELKEKFANSGKNPTNNDYWFKDENGMDKANNDNGISEERRQQIIKAQKMFDEREKKSKNLNMTSTPNPINSAPHCQSLD